MNEDDKKAIECADTISEYCRNHHNCIACVFSFSQVCMLKWCNASQWEESIQKVVNHKEKSMNRSN